MAELPAIPLWTDSYLADTRHLSTLEHGAYLLLLMETWRRKDTALPDDDALWARLAGVDLRTWKRIKPTIRAFFTQRDDGYFEQRRLVDEKQFVMARRDRLSAAAKARHKPRPLKSNDKVSTDAGKRTCINACTERVPTPTPIEVRTPPRVPPQKEAPDEQGKRSRGTRIPEDWQLTDADRSHGRSKGLGEDEIEHEAAGFRDHHTAKGTISKDWAASWRTWIWKREQFKPRDRHSAADRQGNSLSGLHKAVTTQAQNAGQRHGSGNGAGSPDAGAPDGPRSIEGGLAGEPLADDVGGLFAGAGKLPGA